jgi:anti-sigma B factor antagonist
MNQLKVINDEQEKSSITVEAPKRLDNSNISQLNSTLSKVQEKGYEHIKIDCSKLEFISSSGIGTIVTKNSLFRNEGKKLTLSSVPEMIKFVLSELDVIDLLNIE